MSSSDGARTIAGIMLVPAGFNLAEWMLRDDISRLLAGVLRLWIDKLGIDGVVLEQLTL